MELKSRINSDSLINKLVEVSIRFLSIGEIDTMNEKYQAEILIESKWNLDDLLTYDPKVDWNPKLYVENALNDCKEQITYQSFHDGTCLTIIETRYIKGIIKLIHLFTKIINK
jgi:hypothetical protein